jgi:hypothetical protein
VTRVTPLVVIALLGVPAGAGAVQTDMQKLQKAIALERDALDDIAHGLVPGAKSDLAKALKRLRSIPRAAHSSAIGRDLDAAVSRDVAAINRLRERRLGKAEGKIRAALKAKRRALEAMRAEGDTGCSLSREAAGDITSVKVADCKLPVVSVKLTSSAPLNLTGHPSLLPDGNAECTQTSPNEIDCTADKPVTDGRQLFVDLSDPPAEGAITVETCDGGRCGKANV